MATGWPSSTSSSPPLPPLTSRPDAVALEPIAPHDAQADTPERPSARAVQLASQSSGSTSVQHDNTTQQPWATYEVRRYASLGSSQGDIEDPLRSEKDMKPSEDDPVTKQGSLHDPERTDDAGQAQFCKDENGEEGMPTQMHVKMFSHSHSNEAEQHDERPSQQPGFDDLFFDLLFAAALSVYSNNADLSSAVKVGVYIGYFSLLWWSWWTQTLFDVRYRGRDRVGFFMQCAQRIIRCCLLGVWVAYATVTSEFARSGYVNFTTIYICSRAALIADYIVVIIRSARYPYATKDAHIPGVVEHRGRCRFSTLTCHLIMIAGTVISMLLWIVSRFVDDGKSALPGQTIGVWIVGIMCEMVAEMLVELGGPLRSLSATPIVERLALFSLIVFGNGFENIGTALNAISPGNKDYDRGGIPTGGWSGITILNAAASVIIVMLLFFGYFSRAIKEFVAHPARILIWSYMHVLLHVSAGVLMIGLGKVIGFVNTLNALDRITSSPELYLPNTPDWIDYFQNDFENRFFNNDTLPAVFEVENYYDRTLLSILVSTTSIQGAIIPDVQLGTAMANSTLPFVGVTIPAALKTALQTYTSLVENMQSPDGLQKYTLENAYSFYYTYLCPAIFLLTDVVLKLLQHSVGGWRKLGRRLIVSLCVRVAFAIILVLVQVAYLLTLLDAGNNAVLDCLIILACILLLESIIQSLLFFFDAFVGYYRRTFPRERQYY